MIEIITLVNDIEIFYQTADSFPEGILAAHKKLHSVIPFLHERNYFGISRPENGRVVYKACAEVLDVAEKEKYQLNTLVLKKGKYISTLVHNFKKKPESIGLAFQKLLSNPNLDPIGYCVEWYMNDDETVKCLVRLKD